MRRFGLFFVLVLIASLSGFLGHGFPPEAHAQVNGEMQDFAELWNTGVVAANTNLLTVSATQTTTPLHKISALRITVALVTTSSVFNVVTSDGTHTFTSSLNGGTALVAGCTYTFVIGARNVASSNGTTSKVPLTINFQVATLTTLEELLVEEVTTPTF